MTATAAAHVVVKVNPRTGDITQVLGVFTDGALARKVSLRRNNTIVISGPPNREWSAPK